MKRFIAIAAAALLVFAPARVFAAEDGAVTRGEFVAAMNELFGFYNVLGDEEAFTDLKLGDAGFMEFMAARRAGYIGGYPDGSSGAAQAVTRAEAAVMLAEILSLAPAESPESTNIPEWAAGSAVAVIEKGLMSGDAGSFGADSVLTETELAQIVEAASQYPMDRSDKLMQIPSFDGHTITGRLSMPGGEEAVDKVVIMVHGTGPNTYVMDRGGEEYGYRFRYLDVYAEGFVKDGTAFFSYNTRGVSRGKGSVNAQDAVIDTEAYRGYTPQNSAHDLKYMIDALKAEPRLSGAQVFLLGTSEGTMIAPLAVSEYGAQADALLLAGYVNVKMPEVLRYQLTGGMSFFNYTLMFDAFGAEAITPEMFEADPQGVRPVSLPGIEFEHIDATADGLLTAADFEVLMTPLFEGLMTAVDNSDDKWIEDNMSAIMPPLLTDWFQGHAQLPDNEDTMAKLDLPLYIFQGTYDSKCPVQWTYDVQARFETLGKTNLTVNIYDGYDHDLNASYYIFGQGSQAIDDMFATVEGFGM